MAATAALQPPSDGFRSAFTTTPRYPVEEKREKSSFHTPLKRDQVKVETPPVDVDTWPRYLKSPMAWTGQDIKNPSTYTYYLSGEELQEIDNGLKHFQSLGLWGGEINGRNFPLPNLSKKLAMLKQDVLSGHGFVNIRGLTVDKYSPEDTSLVFVGICHIKEASRSETTQNHRPFRDSNLALTYHTDGYCPILGVQIRAEAAEGGDHLLASSRCIYNELAATRPDIIRLLATPNWHFDPRGIHDDPRPRSLFYYEGESQKGAGDGKLITNFIRYLLTGRPGVPKLSTSPDCTPLQIEALDAVEALAQKHSLTLDQQPGDIVFINNWSILHSRTAFRNDDEHVRYLVRIWLKNEDPALEWPIPAVFRMGHMKLFDQDEDMLKWNVTPQPRLSFKIYQTLTQA